MFDLQKFFNKALIGLLTKQQKQEKYGKIRGKGGREDAAEIPYGNNRGLDITTLTTEIFGLEATNSGFHYLLQSLVNKYHDYDAVLRALKGQLGDEGRALVRTMVALDTEETGEDDKDE